MSVSGIRMRPMHQRPNCRKIVVQMKDGRQLACSACDVYTREWSGVIIYHKRKAIDESGAEGWWPVQEISHVIKS